MRRPVSGKFAVELVVLSKQCRSSTQEGPRPLADVGALVEASRWLAGARLSRWCGERPEENALGRLFFSGTDACRPTTDLYGSLLIELAASEREDLDLPLDHTLHQDAV